MDRLTLGELTDAADVSVRTVRYYIAEGLLPPPEGAGPGSAYTRGHLDRLRLIQRLKEAYLPLKEIRRRVAGLDDEEVRTFLRDADEGAPGAALPAVAEDDSLAGARRYLAMLDTRERYHTEPMALQLPAQPAPAPPAISGPASAPRAAPERGPRVPAGTVAARPPHPEAPEAIPAQPLWHRIPLGDEAELVISDRVYGRHRDRVDWLVRWARKVFA